MPLRYEHAFLPSTQDEAIRLARAGAADGTRVVARRQGLGRGRLTHAWASPEGGLYLSVIAPEPELEPGLLPVAVAARLAAGLAREFDVASQVKWPNDLLVRAPAGGMRKLGGIIVDRLETPRARARLVVGIGVNVATPRPAFPPELRDRVAILSEIARGRPSLESVESLVAGSVREAIDGLGTAGAVERTVRECRAALYGLGREALVDGAPAGVIRELGDDGALWLERNGERVAVRAGDLTVVEDG